MRDHDDDLSVLLPDHPPESWKGGLGGSLGADVSSGPPEPVDKVGVDVLVLEVRRVTADGRGPVVEDLEVVAAEPHSGVVICRIRKI